MSEFAGFAVVAPEAEGFAQDRQDRISAVMAQAVADKEIPGAVTVVCRRGKVVHNNVVGTLDMHRPEPLGMDSLFRMYSQTKPVTAVVAMTLFEEGVIFLDDSISKWLPEFASPQVVAYPSATDRVKGSPLSLGRTPTAHQSAVVASMEGAGFLPWDESINDPPGTYEDMVLVFIVAKKTCKGWWPIIAGTSTAS